MYSIDLWRGKSLSKLFLATQEKAESPMGECDTSIMDLSLLTFFLRKGLL
jgi:hypothetical protein